MSDTDLELLARYTRHRAEDAFTEIVRRHLGLVYSAALRQVRSPQLAEEVAQSVFIHLAREAGRLRPDTILAAWLYQVTHRTAANVVRGEVRRQMREQIATEMNALNATPADWTHIEPLLDDAMLALDETDRAAVLLRYFENKSLRQVGQALGASENAAQKRLTRAVERLREFFAQRGVTTGVSGLIAVVSANAVQAAPAGLVIMISTAAALAGTTIVTTATTPAAKIIAMTTLQKTLVATALIAAVGTGIYEARQAAVWRKRVVQLYDQAGEQIRQAQRERDEAERQLAVLRSAQPGTDSNAELLRLRGEVGLLRSAAMTANQIANDPSVKKALTSKAKDERLKQLLDERPHQKIPELSLLDERAFLDVAQDANLETEGGIRAALSRLRFVAENQIAIRLQPALQQFALANDSRAPENVSQLATLMDPPIDAAILERYEILNTGTNAAGGWRGGWVISQKSAVDSDYDQRWLISPVGFGPSDFKGKQ